MKSCHAQTRPVRRPDTATGWPPGFATGVLYQTWRHIRGRFQTNDLSVLLYGTPQGRNRSDNEPV